MTTRLAINELRSARARRERYVGEWLPEPIITDGRDDPAAHAEIADSLSLALLVVLESLTPEQRAVLLLRRRPPLLLRGDRADRRQERARRAAAGDAGAASGRGGAPDISGGEIVSVDAVVNPDKLRHLGPIADYEELRRSVE